jgi:hypothetical protein
VIWGNKVFVTAIDGTMKDHCHVVAMNMVDETIAWDLSQEPYQPVRSVDLQKTDIPARLLQLIFADPQERAPHP